MERDTDRYRSLTRRALMLGGIQAGLLSTLVGRMYYLQVLQSDRYTMLAEENRINMRLLSPVARGRYSTGSACRWRSTSRISAS